MVYQSDENGCGKAVTRQLLSMMLKNDVYETIPLSSDCSDFLSIREELAKRKVNYVSFSVDDISKVSKKQLPAIAQVMNCQKPHFVIVKRITKHNVFMFDPEFGWLTLSVKEFLLVFMGKMLLKESVGKAQKLKKTPLLKKSEIFCYALIFLLESLTGIFLFNALASENGFVLSVIYAVGLLIAIIVQNSLNILTRRRLDKDILVPYLRNYKNRKDFENLGVVLNEVISHVSRIVSYLSLSVVSLYLVLINNFAMAFLVLISLVFALIQFYLNRYSNKIRRSCTIEESHFFSELGLNDDVAFNFYEKAQKSAMNFLLSKVSVACLEIIIASIFIFVIMKIENINEVNTFIYLLGFALTISFLFWNLCSSIWDNRERVKAENRLSIPLGIFLLKSGSELKYNNSDKEGTAINERKTHPRVRKSGKSRKGSEKDI